ncbi:uncharacterized protein LOC130124795 [Lampris incognitus]|uniref:uncharacterized protein LOC130124795 n=1 Tax=Lampris incognitus TaxID=2546036 RepID=UPI0024B5CD6D|nr:uncharacterized protein LOC130124795 [Lampris incognitus]
MRLTLDKALAVGNQLEVEAINGTQHVVLTPGLAAQCGYSMESDPWGNTRIYASLMGCFVENEEDKTFVGLRLTMYSQGNSEVITHDVAKTCTYSAWASREIICDRNYMEVSNYIATSDGSVDMKGQDLYSEESKNDASMCEGFSSQPTSHSQATGIWKMTFYTPEPTVMVLREALEAGYGAKMTPNRLVVRSPYNTAETYSEDVAGVPMELLKVSTYYKAQHGLTMVNLAAACPIGGVIFSEDLISWHVPRRITPLIEGRVTILETHMGIDGEGLDKKQMIARHYTLSTTEYHFVVEIPVGSPDGYFKSHAPDYQYHLSYTVEPMLEILWRADNHADTRYKILFPITTPLMPWLPELSDNTIPEERVFNAQLGLFLHDVELVNITFSTGILSVAECNARGLTVQEHSSHNGSKTFTLTIPFAEDAVLKYNSEPLVTVYYLSVILGFFILPEQTPFSHPLELEASLQDVVLPSIAGTCDETFFYISVKYGSQGHNFQTMIGARLLTSDLGEVYSLTENGTHFSFFLPYTSPDTVFELVETFSVKARVDLLLWNVDNNWKLGDFSLACNFPLNTTKCFTNGTVSVLALKVESVPNLTPSWLTLTDKACKPYFSDDRFAYFSFTVDSCGTTRTFLDNYMVYENVITMDQHSKAYASPADPSYRHTVSCYYLINETESLAFHYKPRDKMPTAEAGSGQLMVQMRLAQDAEYKRFYQVTDYPIVKYLREPLFFEVELMQSTDNQLELILDNCWATLNEDRTSLPSWDLIVDGCENLDDNYMTVFHPVVTEARVPAHIKRFSMKTFTFTNDAEVLKNQIFVHCDAVICEAKSTLDGICSGQCVNAKGIRARPFKGLRKGEKLCSALRGVYTSAIGADVTACFM